MYNNCMEMILKYLNIFNRYYLKYIALILGIIFLAVLIKLLFSLSKSKRLIKNNLEASNDILIKVKATETKCQVLQQDFQHKNNILWKTISIVSLLKYYRKRENRQNEKAIKEYYKHQKQMQRIFK